MVTNWHRVSFPRKWESRKEKPGFLLEFIPYLIRGRNDFSGKGISDSLDDVRNIFSEEINEG